MKTRHRAYTDEELKALGIETLYVTDYGTIKLSDKDLFDRRADAESMQMLMWKNHEDDLIGVPEVEAFNNLVHAELHERTKRQWIEDDGPAQAIAPL